MLIGEPGLQNGHRRGMALRIIDGDVPEGLQHGEIAASTWARRSQSQILGEFKERPVVLRTAADADYFVHDEMHTPSQPVRARVSGCVRPAEARPARGELHLSVPPR